MPKSFSGNPSNVFGVRDLEGTHLVTSMNSPERIGKNKGYGSFLVIPYIHIYILYIYISNRVLHRLQDINIHSTLFAVNPVCAWCGSPGPKVNTFRHLTHSLDYLCARHQVPARLSQLFYPPKPHRGAHQLWLDATKCLRMLRHRKLRNSTETRNTNQLVGKGRQFLQSTFYSLSPLSLNTSHEDAVTCLTFV